MVSVDDFYNGYGEAKMTGGNLPDGTYELFITENRGAPSTDPKVHTDGFVEQTAMCATEVVGSEFDGDRGPLLFLKCGGYTFEKNGNSRTVSTEDTIKRLQGRVRAIHGKAIPPVTEITSICDQLADACVGDHFIARVTSNDRGMNISRIWSMDEPPEGFVAAATAADFTA